MSYAPVRCIRCNTTWRVEVPGDPNPIETICLKCREEREALKPSRHSTLLDIADLALKYRRTLREYNKVCHKPRRFDVLWGDSWARVQVLCQRASIALNEACDLVLNKETK